MPFTSRPGLNGKVYVPVQHPGQRKHDCRNCYSCQVCSDDRCSLCRGRADSEQDGGRTGTHGCCLPEKVHSEMTI